ncbi:hypothetical protein [Bremerella sp. P1]|nr:hypothetical protein [Bremerella sp. P1]WDI44965.1 hypothetical protein PSR63_13560 [Bremerella sp. P1]
MESAFRQVMTDRIAAAHTQWCDIQQDVENQSGNYLGMDSA